MDFDINSLQNKTKKELIDIILFENDTTKQKKNKQAPYSRNLKDCVTSCRSDRSPKINEFEKKNGVKIRTEADSSRADAAREAGLTKKKK